MKSIAVVSNKRDAGKTITAINLAFGLCKNQKDVLLVDADEHGKINFYLGARDRNTLHDALTGKINLAQAIYLHPAGVRIVPSVMNNYNEHTINIRDAINDLKDRAKVVVVNAPIENANLKNVLEASDEVLFVTESNVNSIKYINELMRKVNADGKTILGLVLTKAGTEDYSAYAAKLTGFPVLAVIPKEDSVVKSLESKTPLIMIEGESMASAEYEKLAFLFS